MLLKLIPSDLVLDYNKLQQKDSGSDIQQLLSFLTQSLAAREQTYTANKSSFELCNRRQETKSNFSREPRSYKQQNQKCFHTASELLTAPVKENKDKIKLICIFCDSMTHNSNECEYVINMSLEERKNILLRKGACFNCLRIAKHLSHLALKHFENTVLREDEGRYIVSIPWIEGNEKLEDHYSLAKGRLEKTVKTLKFTGRLFDYEQLFVDWEKEGITEKIAHDEPKNGGKFHYLPHRPVFKENSTTKIRPVFDGSAHHGKSCSLNDCVEKGHNLIEMIPAILNRFRLGKIGVISDIRKAFLQISLHENDMNFLHFLWWEGGNSENAVIYRHRRVVFEASCSPFLLAAVLNHHFKQAPEHFEKAAEKLIDSMFVDNCVASVDSSEELECFQRDSTELLALGKFDLHGWRHSDIESNFDFQDNQQKSDPEEILVLRLMWNVKEDTRARFPSLTEKQNRKKSQKEEFFHWLIDILTR
ncbi:integrase catalytic domain-containing protein [Trichonephila clavipes]|nr:integrase catalytic domain-containing protein [Trichonephila clavipes]